MPFVAPLFMVARLAFQLVLLGAGAPGDSVARWAFTGLTPSRPLLPWGLWLTAAGYSWCLMAQMATFAAPVLLSAGVTNLARAALVLGAPKPNPSIL